MSGRIIVKPGLPTMRAAAVRGSAIASALLLFVIAVGFHSRRPGEPAPPDRKRVARAARQRAIDEASKAAVPPQQKLQLVQQVTTQGDNFFRSGNFVAARHHYEQAIQLARPSDAESGRLGDEKAAVREADAPSHRSPLTAHHSSDLGEAEAVARYRLGFAYARQRKYRDAIAAFRQCLDEYRGTHERSDLTFGTVPEKAQYQLACCYRGLYREAKGTSDDSAIRHLQSALAEFTLVIQRYPQSPYAHKAARAIADLNGGKLPKSAGAAYGHALRLEEKQRKEERLRMAQCGPEALRWLVTRQTVDNSRNRSPAHPLTHSPTLDQLTKDCQTGENGTSVFHLIQAGRKHGLELQALAVTEDGLRKLLGMPSRAVSTSPPPPVDAASRLPLILLWNRHYTIVTRVTGETLQLLELTGRTGKAATRSVRVAELFAHDRLAETSKPKEAVVHLIVPQHFAASGNEVGLKTSGQPESRSESKEE